MSANTLSDKWALRFKQNVHFRGERKVHFGHAAGIMRVQIDGDFVPHVEPFGMVIHAFGDEGGSRHEAECFNEIGELKIAMELSVVQRPAVQGGKFGDDLGLAQLFSFVRHGSFPP